jgi:hypothetical protein
MPRIAKDVAKFNGGFGQSVLAAARVKAPIARGGRRLSELVHAKASVTASLDWRTHIP